MLRRVAGLDLRPASGAPRPELRRARRTRRCTGAGALVLPAARPQPSGAADPGTCFVWISLCVVRPEPECRWESLLSRPQRWARACDADATQDDQRPPMSVHWGTVPDVDVGGRVRRAEPPETPGRFSLADGLVGRAWQGCCSGWWIGVFANAVNTMVGPSVLAGSRASNAPNAAGPGRLS
jgi:hypothetical protein